MKDRKPKSIIPIPLSAACVLLSLVLLSSHFTSGMYARYVTRALGGDSAKIAAFRVSAVPGAEETVKIVRGSEPDKYTLTVSNSGLTAVEFVAAVEFTAKDREPAYTIEMEDGDKILTAEGEALTGFLSPGESRELSLSFDLTELLKQAEAEGLDFSNAETTGESGEIPFAVNVTFTQIN